MIPLVCIDVDGTLVGSSGIVTDAVWGAVDAALDRGQHLALSTARGAFANSWDMAQRLDPSGWHVFHAGGATVHTGTGEAQGRFFNADQVEQIVALSKEHDWILELYSATDYAVDSEEPAAVDHAALIGVPFVRRDLRNFIEDVDGIVRAQLVVPESLVEAITPILAPTGLTVTSATSPIMPQVAFVSLTLPGVTKATGIAVICEVLGLQMSDVMMIGDGLNDLPAIEAVGHPVAMGNAAPAVKSAARYQVADVAADGVVEALQLSAKLDPTSD